MVSASFKPFRYYQDGFSLSEAVFLILFWPKGNKKAFSALRRRLVVAGTGFEPMTFGL
jgi:hypothetical protein